MSCVLLNSQRSAKDVDMVWAPQHMNNRILTWQIPFGFYGALCEFDGCFLWLSVGEAHCKT